MTRTKPPCSQCKSNASVKTFGGGTHRGTHQQYRYGCEKCGFRWQQIPPHRMNLSVDTLDEVTTSGNLVVGGNLTVTGSTVTNSSTNTTIEDRIEIVFERGDSANAFIGWDESADKFTVGTGTFTGASTDGKGIFQLMDWVNTYEEHQRSMYLKKHRMKPNPRGPVCIGCFGRCTKNSGGGPKNKTKWLCLQCGKRWHENNRQIFDDLKAAGADDATARCIKESFAGNRRPYMCGCGQEKRICGHKLSRRVMKKRANQANIEDAAHALLML